MVAQPKFQIRTRLSVWFPFSVITLWTIAWFFGVFFWPAEWPVAARFGFGLVMVQLYTGLFITAHDAMHGSAIPGSRRMNEWVGRLAVFLYAVFPYSRLLSKHQGHHRKPGTFEDPDFHAEGWPSFFSWYLRFVGQYLSFVQVTVMAVLANVLLHLFQIPLENLLMTWIVPSLTSTLQLFFFGTYLPHRKGAEAFVDRHRSRSNDYPVWLSFLTCYHFGYHHEHHLYPEVPWWELPRLRKQRLSS